MPDKFLIIILTAGLLAGCSSPPEPAKTDWEAPSSGMNEEYPGWHSNNVIVHASHIRDDNNGRWALSLRSFNPAKAYAPDVYYVAAHSLKASIKAPDSNSYFTAKQWLINSGYNGKLITFRYCGNCATEILFIR